MALTLRMKSLLIVTLTLVALIVGLYFGIRAIVLDSFSELEQDNVALHVDRVNAAIDNELVKMDLTLKDWSKPGQTVVYGRLIPALDNQRFSVTSEGKNGLADLFANLDLNLWVITESSGEVVWGWGYDENEEEITLVHSSFKDRLIPGSPLLSLGSGERALRGMVIDESQDALLVVARRVDYLDQEGQASPALPGAMIMGRYLDNAEVERLAGQTQLALAVYGLDEPQVPAEIRSQRSVLSETGATLVEPLDDDNVAGYTLLADVGGAPGRLLQVVVPRTSWTRATEASSGS